MNCPECQGKTKVLETRESPHGIRRRRECRGCGRRYTSFEAFVRGVIEARGHATEPPPELLREIAQDAAQDIAGQIDVDEIGQAVTDAIEDRVEQAFDGLPADIVQAMIEAAEERGDLASNGQRLLGAGDDEDDT